MIEAVGRIERYRGREAFESDELKQTWMVHQYQGIDTDVVWSTPEDGVPVPKEQLAAIQNQLDVGE